MFDENYFPDIFETIKNKFFIAGIELNENITHDVFEQSNIYKFYVRQNGRFFAPEIYESLLYESLGKRLFVNGRPIELTKNAYRFWPEFEDEEHDYKSILLNLTRITDGKIVASEITINVANSSSLILNYCLNGESKSVELSIERHYVDLSFFDFYLASVPNSEFGYYAVVSESGPLIVFFTSEQVAKYNSIMPEKLVPFNSNRV